MTKEGIEALDTEAIKDETLDFEDLTSSLALRFERTYRALMDVLSKPNPLSSSASYTPPNHQLFPQTLNFSKKSTLSSVSTSSAASKAEHFIDRFADAFIEASFRLLGAFHGLNRPIYRTMDISSTSTSHGCPMDVGLTFY